MNMYIYIELRVIEEDVLVSIAHPDTHNDVCLYKCMSVCTYTYIYTNMHVCIYAGTYIRIYT